MSGPPRHPALVSLDRAVARQELREKLRREELDRELFRTDLQDEIDNLGRQVADLLRQKERLVYACIKALQGNWKIAARILEDLGYDEQRVRQMLELGEPPK